MALTIGSRYLTALAVAVGEKDIPHRLYAGPLREDVLEGEGQHPEQHGEKKNP